MKIVKNTVPAFHAEMQRRNDAVIFNILSLAGEKAIIEARTNGSYKDRTSNLRNSVGYVVLHNGVTMKTSTPGSGDGKSKALSYLSELSSQYSKGWVLIVVAGMHYAEYVQAKGYNVLSSAENKLKVDVYKMKGLILEKLKET